MSRKLFAIMTALVVIGFLSGCQLAHESTAVNEGRDKLIGVYISYDYVDLFDVESYINDNARFSDGEIKIKGETSQYNGRMYANVKEEIRTSSDGESYTNIQYNFEDIEGIGMYAPTIEDPNEEDMAYISSQCDDGISDMKSNIASSDNEEKLELSCTVYIPSGAMSDAIYVNLVYPREDGSVFLLSGHGFVAKIGRASWMERVFTLV